MEENISYLGTLHENDLFGVQSLSLCWDLLLMMLPPAGGNPCTAPAGGQKARSLLILLCCSEDGERKRPFLGFFSGSFSDDTHCDWFSLFVVLMYIFLSMCLRLYLEILKLAFSLGGY